jgi:hypothetical protein
VTTIKIDQLSNKIFSKKMEGQTPQDSRDFESYVLMKTISNKYRKDVIEECDELRRTKESYPTFNILRVGSKSVTNTEYLEDLYYQVDIGSGSRLRFKLIYHKAHPKEIRHKCGTGYDRSEKIQEDMIPPQWEMGLVEVTQPKQSCPIIED